MEKNCTEKLFMYNGNINHNEFHEDLNSNELQEVPSSTLVFYVNGKEVRSINIINLFLI